MSLLLLLALAGCAGRVTGVVQIESGGGVKLVEAEGDSLRLRLDESSEPLRRLEDCTVELRGPRLAGQLVVRDWSIVAAADGSAPYWGRLHVEGLQVMLDDRGTGSVILMEDASGGALRAFDGQLVMVIGVIVAPHVVRVMGYEVLGP